MTIVIAITMMNIMMMNFYNFFLYIIYLPVEKARENNVNVFDLWNGSSSSSRTK